ncbi:hypothetical protein [Arthrobacter sp. zg-Y1110]|uniref:hypothetical protein n=1 Tax=Arthrobacter sp. zg-Y1110 TaxID=2886932 RepID=UPI001D132C5E|nr:hypothetical protein [Arthrobacter sp. zg-Y1110]MCC3290831.1 hypothetical protein [Arthrobacter sp. zg-Y1110]UWX86246.1 hypothetical protein N2K99_06950 [Arthrobacter sp. zg-Y1110]
MMRKGIAACWVLLAAALLTTGCGGGAGSAPAEQTRSIEPAPAVLPGPQIECPSGADAAPAGPVDAIDPVPAGQSVPEQPTPPDKAAPEATPTDPDPCALSVSRTAEPGEAAEALEYWTPERMDSAIPEMPIENEPRREGGHSPSDPSETIGVTPATSR